MAGDANAGAAARLPQDVLATILLRLPASDLRRFRRVCKEWRDVISEPAFLDEHTVHGPRALTHTIVFFPGYSRIHNARSGSDGGSGFLFDEQWRLTATFTTGRSEDMIATCNGLLCLLDHGQGAITVVEPFTGELLALPLPPETRRRYECYAYCFGFDPGSRRYKVVHKGFQDGSEEQAVHVCTVGGGESWRSVHVAGGAAGEAHRGPACADGAVYWTVAGEDWETRIARLDLATEEVTWDSMRNLITPALSATTGSDARVCVMGLGPSLFGYWDALLIGDGGRFWVHEIVKLPPLRRPSLRQPMQRGHLLLEDRGDGGMYAHPIAPSRNGVGLGKMLLKIGSEEEPAMARSSSSSQDADRTPGLFAAVPFSQEPAAQVRRAPHEPGNARTFCYVPTASPAPLAHYFGNL